MKTKTYAHYLKDFKETLVIEFDEEYEESEIKECIESAYEDYMHPEYAEAEMETEIENSTIDGWITDCLCNNDFHVDSWKVVSGKIG